VVVCGGRRDRWAVRRRCGRAGITEVQVIPRDELLVRRKLPTAGACALRFAPARGEPRVVAAEADASTLGYLEAAGHAAKGSRRALIVAPGIAEDRLHAPAYVREIAAGAGLDLTAHRAGLVAPAGYASRKAVMFLFRGEESEPDLVVKVAGDARQNERLENEWRALKWLVEAGVPGDLPRPLFFGHHAGLALLGESVVRGSPFRGGTSGRPDCPLARAALDWLLELGVGTAHPVPGNEDVGAALGELAARFDALYRLTRRQRAKLEHQLDLLASANAPLVLQHGDPGVWNLLVDAGGRPAFLDWEAAERHGMPLWDVFYFARSFAVTVARTRGRCTSLGAVRRVLLADSPVSRLLASAVERHCAEIGLDKALVEPLFVTCWMHRALKEATRLPPARLDSGHYVNLLRLCLVAS
jgi:hypothetical protein